MEHLMHASLHCSISMYILSLNYLNLLHNLIFQVSHHLEPVIVEFIRCTILVVTRLCLDNIIILIKEKLNIAETGQNVIFLDR